MAETKRRTRGQAVVELRSSWDQARVKLGSTRDQAGDKLGSSWGQARVNLQRLTWVPISVESPLPRSSSSAWITTARPTMELAPPRGICASVMVNSQAAAVATTSEQGRLTQYTRLQTEQGQVPQGTSIYSVVSVGCHRTQETRVSKRNMEGNATRKVATHGGCGMSSTSRNESLNIGQG